LEYFKLITVDQKLLNSRGDNIKAFSKYIQLNSP